jgi:glycosyltransferase involved in cell wall biosynthesis
MKQPDVSVIIPLYNRANLICFTLESLRADLHPGVGLEIIVVNDASTDDGVERVARNFPNVRVLNQEHSGAPAARNAGLALASAEATLLLDSDDLVEPGFFKPRLDALREHQVADGAYGPFDHFVGEVDFKEEEVSPRHSRYPIERVPASRSHLIRLLGGWYLPPHTILWRTHALRRAGGQRRELSVNQDVDLMFRMLIAGEGIVGSKGPRALYREHTGERQGVIGSSVRKVTEMFELRRSFAERLEAAGLLDDEARRALGEFCFSQWTAIRDEMPSLAEKFFVLSQELFPDLRLKGRWSLRALSAVAGPKRAILLRDRLRRA